MKNILLSFCLSIGLSASFAQSVFEKILTNEIELALSDGVRLDDGSWMFSAFAYSITPGDSAMAMVIKTDSTFSPIWAKRYKNLRRDDFSCITPLSDGNVLIGGTMRQSFALEEGGSVLKLDTAGNVLWHQLYDEDFDDRVLEIFEQADSSLMIFIREGVTNRPSKVVHTTKNGAILTQRTYKVDSTSLGLLANSVVADEQGQYYFSGAVPIQGMQEVFVCAVDDTDLLWNKGFQFSGRNVGSFKSVYLPDDQTIMLGGFIADTVGIFGNIWLLKMDLTGTVIWAKEYGRQERFTENISGIMPLDSGKIMMYGTFFGDQGSQGFVMALDSLGNKIWENAYAPASPSFGIADVFVLPDGRLLANANSGEEVYLLTLSASGETVCNSTDVEMIVAPLPVKDTTYSLIVDSPGIVEVTPVLEVTDVQVQDSVSCSGSVSLGTEVRLQLEIYPNPVQDQLTVILPEGIDQAVACTIVDAVGRIISPKTVRSGSEIIVDVTDLAAGVYWLQLSTDGENVARTFVRRE